MRSPKIAAEVASMLPSAGNIPRVFFGLESGSPEDWMRVGWQAVMIVEDLTFLRLLLGVCKVHVARL